MIKTSAVPGKNTVCCCNRLPYFVFKSSAYYQVNYKLLWYKPCMHIYEILFYIHHNQIRMAPKQVSILNRLFGGVHASAHGHKNSFSVIR